MLKFHFFCRSIFNYGTCLHLGWGIVMWRSHCQVKVRNLVQFILVSPEWHSRPRWEFDLLNKNEVWVIFPFGMSEICFDSCKWTYLKISILKKISIFFFLFNLGQKIPNFDRWRYHDWSLNIYFIDCLQCSLNLQLLIRLYLTQWVTPIIR